MKRQVGILVLLSILAGVCIWLQPLTSDDFTYSFYRNTEVRITSFIEAINSACDYYVNWNGRFFPNLFTHISLCLLPHWWTLLIGTLTITATIFVCKKIASDKIYIPVLFILYWLFNPDKNDCIFWTTGFYNYAFPGLFGLCVIFLFKQYSTRIQTINILLLFFGIFASFQQEGISLPLSGAFLFWFCSSSNRKRTNSSQIFLVSGFWLGTIMCTFAPGTLVRIKTMSEIANNYSIDYKTTILNCIIALITLWGLIFILFFRRSQFKEYLKQKQLEVTIVILSILMYVVLSIIADIPAIRFFYFTHLITCILLSEVLFGIISNDNMNFYKVPMVYGLSILIVVVSVFLQYDKNKVVNRELEFIKNSDSYVVPIDITYLSPDPNCWINKDVSKYYKKDSLKPCPSALYYNLYLDEKLQNKSNVEGWYIINKKYYVKPLDRHNVPTSIQWTRYIDFPLLSNLKIIRKVEPEIFFSKSQEKYLILKEERPFISVECIEEHY